MDKLSLEQRKKAMTAIRSQDSKIEIVLRHALWEKGIRYRKNYRKILGKPDIYLAKYKICIFCDSEFWHGKNYSNRMFEGTQNKDFWERKILRNIQRDLEINESLKQQGFKVLRFWGNEIVHNTEGCIKIVEELIKQIDAF